MSLAKLGLFAILSLSATFPLASISGYGARHRQYYYHRRLACHSYPGYAYYSLYCGLQVSGRFGYYKTLNPTFALLSKMPQTPRRQPKKPKKDKKVVESPLTATQLLLNPPRSPQSTLAAPSPASGLPTLTGEGTNPFDDQKILGNLPVPQNCVRLVILPPAEDLNSPLRLNMIMHDFEKLLPIYAAVACPWNLPEEPGIPITVNGNEFFIQKSLHAALLFIRHHTRFERRSLGVPLWIDSVCINYWDDDERRIQARLMKDIFKKARIVYDFWKKPEDDRKAGSASKRDEEIGTEN